jgi:hypothetical protein
MALVYVISATLYSKHASKESFGRLLRTIPGNHSSGVHTSRNKAKKVFSNSCYFPSFGRGIILAIILTLLYHVRSDTTEGLGVGH